MSAIFLEIFNMSISASYLIAAVALIRLVLKKAAMPLFICNPFILYIKDT